MLEPQEEPLEAYNWRRAEIDDTLRAHKHGNPQARWQQKPLNGHAHAAAIWHAQSTPPPVPSQRSLPPVHAGQNQPPSIPPLSDHERPTKPSAAFASHYASSLQPPATPRAGALHPPVHHAAAEPASASFWAPLSLRLKSAGKLLRLVAAFPITWVALVVVCVVLAALVGSYQRHMRTHRHAQHAVQQASMLGSQPSLDAAIAALELQLQEYDRPHAKLGRLVASWLHVARKKAQAQWPHKGEIKAKLSLWHAVGAMEHADAYAATARRWLQRLEGDERQLLEAQIARGYLSLWRGNGQDSTAAVWKSAGNNDALAAAEMYRMQAQTQWQQGNISAATAYAKSAVEAQSDAARQQTLLALLLAEEGQHEQALALLGKIRKGDTLAVVRLARARVLRGQTQAQAWAATEVQALVRGFGANLSPAQQSWVQLILAEQQLAAGQTEQAAEKAHRAMTTVIAADGGLRQAIAAVFQQTGHDEQANALVDTTRLAAASLKKKVSGSAAAAHWQWLQSQDTSALQQALAQKQPTHVAALLRGQLALLQGEAAGAVAHFEQAQAVAATRLPATLGLARAQAGSGDRAAAEATLQNHLEADQSGRLRAALVHQLLDGKDLSGAAAVLGAAKAKVRSEAPWQQAQAALSFAQGEIAPAKDRLASLTATKDAAANVHALHGEALRRLDDLPGAQTAFTKALKQQPQHPKAMAGLVLVLFEQGQQAQALQQLAAVQARSQRALPEALNFAKAFVAVGAGRLAADILMPHTQVATAAEFWSTMGWAMVQAEQEADARRAFKRAMEIERTSMAALTGMAFVESRFGSTSAATRMLQAAASVLQSQGRDPQGHPDYLAVQARLYFESERLSQAAQAAAAAVQQDPMQAHAHLILAVVAQEKRQPFALHLQRALRGHAPLPEAMGRLATSMRSSDVQRRLFRRYLVSAPKGYDASAAKKALRRTGSLPKDAVAINTPMLPL